MSSICTFAMFVETGRILYRNLTVMTSTVDNSTSLVHRLLMCKFEFLQCNATFRGDNS